MFIDCITIISIIVIDVPSIAITVIIITSSIRSGIIGIHTIAIIKVDMINSIIIIIISRAIMIIIFLS